MSWRRAWQPTPVFLPGESYGQRSLAGYNTGSTKSWTRLKQLSMHTCMVVLFLVFWETSILFSIVAASVFIPTSSVWGFSFLYTFQFSSVTQLCPTLCNPMNRSMPGFPVHHQLLEFTQTQAHRVSGATQPSHPLSSLSPPAPNPSQHQGLCQWVNSSHEVAKVLEFQLQHQSFQWTPRTDVRMDWLDFLAVQGTLKSLLQHHSSKASIFQRPAFFTVQLSHPYVTTGKNIALTRQTFVENED